MSSRGWVAGGSWVGRRWVMGGSRVRLGPGRGGAEKQTKQRKQKPPAGTTPPAITRPGSFMGYSDHIIIMLLLHSFLLVVYKSEGGTPNGVMKLPGRVMAGGVVPAGGFWFLLFSAPPRVGLSRTRGPPATHPRPTHDPPAATHPRHTHDPSATHPTTPYPIPHHTFWYGVVLSYVVCVCGYVVFCLRTGGGGGSRKYTALDKTRLVKPISL